MSLDFHANVCQARAALALHTGESLPESLIVIPAHPFRQRGFTLVELLLVVTLIGITVGLVSLTQTDDVREDSEDRLVLVEMIQIRKALFQFKRDVGHFPDAAELFDEKDRLRLLWTCQSTNTAGDDYDGGCHKPYNQDTKRGWNGFYMLSEQGEAGPALYDPWGKRYILRDPNSITPGSGSARIVSGGPNGEIDQVIPAPNPCLPDLGTDDIILCLVQ